MKNALFMPTLLSFPLAARQNLLIESKGAVLNTWIYPKQNVETVILLHGGPGVPDPMHPIIDLLKGRLQVIYFQQRGTGASVCTNGSYAMEDYFADLDAVAEYFKLGKFHLFGHSWGGLYAQIYAQERPEKVHSLFLCSPSSGTGEVWKQTEKEVMQFNKSAVSTWQWLGMGWRSLLGALGSDRAYRLLFQSVLENYNKGFATTSTETTDWLEDVAAGPVNKTRKSILAWPMLRQMNDCPFPVTITYGARDIYGESRRHVTERYPGAETIVIPDSGHLPWVQQPELFAEIVAGHYRRGI